MKKLFLLAGLMLCFVLVQAMVVVEPPGKDHVCNAVVCQADVVEFQAIDVSAGYSYELTAGFIPFATYVDIEKAELNQVQTIPGIVSLDLLFWNRFYDDLTAVARSGVINSMNFLSNYNTAHATTNLNFDGMHDRFY